MGYNPSRTINQKRYRERHKKLGLCTLCSEKAAPDKFLCQDHSDKKNKWAMDRRKKLKNGT